VPSELTGQTLASTQMSKVEWIDRAGPVFFSCSW